jgi:GT2 family glycosyltransferase
MHSPKPHVSVVIPTYNRAEILRKTLGAYAEQDSYEQILEVLVVDDGSKDHTRSVVEESCRNSRVPLRYFHQENSGLSAARNHAMREALGDLILFGDDDIIPGRSMVSEHLAWHQRHPEPTVGVLGHVDWAPEIRATAFMQWSGLYGPQFHFGRYRADTELDYSQSYFCNTSVKASFLKQNGFFDENFRGYGWEDIEFSYRLYQNGWRLRYNPRAIGFHNKFERFDQCVRRVERLWWQGWPVFLKTEAGKHSFQLWSAQRAQSAGQRRGALGWLLGPLKLAAVPILRPLMDLRLKFPDKVYDFVWYHYSKPIMDAAFFQPEKTERDAGSAKAASAARDLL